jgi:ABC-type sugar transport system substrate-binding protein
MTARRVCFTAATGCLIACVAVGALAQQSKPVTMGYSVGFLTDPFQAIQVDLTVAAAK